MPAVRYPISTAIVAAALALTAAVFLFARPVYQAAGQGETIKLPGQWAPVHAARWEWAKEPGWKPGQMFGKHHDFNASGLQPIEVQAAQLAAAHSLLDAASVRVLVSTRTDDRGPAAVLAASQLTEGPQQTCLAVQLPGAAPVRWQCPGAHNAGSLDSSRVLLVAETMRTDISHTPLFVLGVARGDVTKVVQITPKGEQLGAHGPLRTMREAIYVRGSTWGEFEATRWAQPGERLLVYTKRGLVQTIDLNLPAGTQRVIG